MKAIHLWFRMAGEELNNAGLYLSNIIRLDTPWNEYLVKLLLWKSTQKRLFGTDSCAKLLSNQIDPIYDVINRATSEKGLSVPLPSIQHVLQNKELTQK